MTAIGWCRRRRRNRGQGWIARQAGSRCATLTGTRVERCSAICRSWQRGSRWRAGARQLCVHLKIMKSGNRFSLDLHRHLRTQETLAAIEIEPFEVVVSDGVRARVVLDDRRVERLARRPPLALRLLKSIMTMHDHLGEARRPIHARGPTDRGPVAWLRRSGPSLDDRARAADLAEHSRHGALPDRLGRRAARGRGMEAETDSAVAALAARGGEAGSVPFRPGRSASARRCEGPRAAKGESLRVRVRRAAAARSCWAMRGRRSPARSMSRVPTSSSTCWAGCCANRSSPNGGWRRRRSPLASARRPGLDAARALAVGLVIGIHALLPFMETPVGWAIRDRPRHALVDLTVWVGRSFVLPAFFGSPASSHGASSSAGAWRTSCASGSPGWASPSCS